MKRGGQLHLEIGLVAVAMAISVMGFWDIYFGPDANAQPHHHLHITTAFIWMSLLLNQLILIGRNSYARHRRVGLMVLVVAPLLVGTTAMLSVHSAHRGVVSGEGDFLIVQNVMVTFELGLLIFLAFLLKRRRKLHGALLTSTTILFMGVALFFAMISFVPLFRIEGPETFHRFQMASITGQAICLAVGLGFYLRDRRNGWPYLLAGFCFPLNEAIRFTLTNLGLIEPLTELVGSISRPIAFTAMFALLFVLLVSTALPTARQARTV